MVNGEQPEGGRSGGLSFPPLGPVTMLHPLSSAVAWSVTRLMSPLHCMQHAGACVCVYMHIRVEEDICGLHGNLRSFTPKNVQNSCYMLALPITHAWSTCARLRTEKVLLFIALVSDISVCLPLNAGHEALRF